MNNKACKYIISLIRTIPISVHKGQHALLLADNSAESIALFGFFLKNNVPLILLNASMRDEQVQEYMDEYRPQWFMYPKNRNLPQYSGGQTGHSENRKRYQCYETACEWNGYVIASRGNAGFELTYHWLEGSGVTNTNIGEYRRAKTGDAYESKAGGQCQVDRRVSAYGLYRAVSCAYASLILLWSFCGQFHDLCRRPSAYPGNRYFS